MRQAKISILFVVQGNLLIDAAPLAQGEPYGDAINFSGHFDYWEATPGQSTPKRHGLSNPPKQTDDFLLSHQ